MPRGVNAELKTGTYNFNPNYTRGYFPSEEDLTPNRLYELVEPGLSTDDGKNALKEILNSYSTGHMDHVPDLQINLINDCGSFLKGKIDEKTFYNRLNKHVLDYYGRVGKKPNLKEFDDKTDYMKSAKEYLEEAHAELDSKVDKGENVSKKAEVKEIGLVNLINEVNKTNAAKEDTALIELIDKEDTIKIKGLNGNPGEKEYTTEEIYKLCVPKLENNAQKNMFLSMLNAFTEGEFSQTSCETLLKEYIKDFTKKDSGTDAKHFTIQLKALAQREINEEYVKLGISSRMPATNFKKAIKYAEDSVTELKEISKRNEPESSKAFAAPDLSDKDAAGWILSLPQKATDAKGKWRDSSKYKTFYSNVEVVKDIAEKYIKAKNNNLNSVSLESFDKKTREVLKSYAVNGEIPMDYMKTAYKKSWKELQKSAYAYENYKLKDKGFTRDPKGKGNQLDSSGKKKFAIMDEVLGRKPRKAYEPKVKQGGQITM